MAQAMYQLMSYGLAGMLMLWLGAMPGALLEPSRVRGEAYPLAAGILLSAIPLTILVTFTPEMFHLPARWQALEQALREQELLTSRIFEGLMIQPDLVPMLANLVTFSLIPACCEEIFFRGFLQHQMSRLVPVWAAILITSLIFSFLHFQVYGLIARAILGALLGWIAWRTGSLLPGIAAHAVFNGFSVVMAWMAARNPALEAIVAADAGQVPVWIQLVALTAAVLLCLRLHIRFLPPTADATHVE
jgi:membrane protease YdiL (CAAX protease family)